MTKANKKTTNFSSHFILPRLILITVALLVICIIEGKAQLKETPLPAPASRSKIAFRTSEELPPPISLPFWDDFSTNITGFPDTLWVNSGNVQITTHTGNKFPSVNVAHFDGRNKAGEPYTPNEPTAKGFTDSLVSRGIKLNEVPQERRDQVFLSFYYQWGGKTEAPDPNDFLRLEFRNDANRWDVIHNIYGDSELQRDSFYLAVFPITDEKYFHENFQFRFRNYGRSSGPFDAWNIDYVYLNDNLDLIEAEWFPDQTISSPLTSLIAPYRAVPLQHFKEFNPITAPSFGLKNLKERYEPLQYTVSATFTNYTETDTTEYTTVMGGGDPLSIPNAGLTASQHYIATLPDFALPDPEDVNQFNPDAKQVKINMKIHALTGDVYKTHPDSLTFFSDDYENKRLEPLDFRANDTTSTSITLSNYYAYDDGTAEYSAELFEAGNMVAYRFDLLTDTATLSAIDIHFPYFTGSTSQSVRLYVYADNNGFPREPALFSLQRTITKNNANQFVTTPLNPSVFVEKTFYIAVKRIETGPVHIGLDKSSDSSDKIFVSTSAVNNIPQWEPNYDFVRGNLMIRPVIGSGGGPNVGIEEEEEEMIAKMIFPNPNRGTFYVPALLNVVQITDIAGRPVSFSSEELGDHNRIILSHVSSGLYLIHWRKGSSSHTSKIVVGR